MNDCSYLDRLDTSMGSELFDHPHYVYICEKFEKELLTLIPCEHCPYYDEVL